MKITYKYRIGQKVTLSKLNLKGDFRREEDFQPFLDKEVTIIERGFVYEDETHHSRQANDKMRFEIFYYIDVDPWYTSPNKHCGSLTKIPESCLDACGAWEEVDEKFTSVDGIDIVPLETRIYDRVIERYEEKGKVITKARCMFTFSTEGTCVGLRKNYEIHNGYLNKKYAKDSYQVKDVKVSREFLTDFEPDEKHDWKTHPRQDAAAYGYESWINLCADPKLGSLFCTIPEDYAEIYVRTATTDSFLRKCGFNPFFDSNFKWEIEQWLTRYGVYDQVKKLWEKAKPGENKRKSQEEKEHDKFVKTAQKFIDSLTDQQKEELKKML